MNLIAHCVPGAAARDMLAREMGDHPVELANLTEQDTGLPGIVYVSTRQGRHGPRVKWYPRRGGSDEAFPTITLEDPPPIINHGVPAREAPAVMAAAEWATINRAALLGFWAEGNALTFHKVGGVLRGLAKLP